MDDFIAYVLRHDSLLKLIIEGHGSGKLLRTEGSEL